MKCRKLEDDVFELTKDSLEAANNNENSRSQATGIHIYGDLHGCSVFILSAERCDLCQIEEMKAVSEGRLKKRV